MSFASPGLSELATRLEYQAALVRRAAADLYCCATSAQWRGHAATAFLDEAMGVRQRLLAAADQIDAAAAAIRGWVAGPALAGVP